MKIFRILSLLFFLCLAILAKAQKYEVDCLVGPELNAVAADKPTDFDGSRNVIYIRNGTIVNVVEPCAYQRVAHTPLWCRDDDSCTCSYSHLCCGCGYGCSDFDVDINGFGFSLTIDSFHSVNRHR